MKKEGKTEYGRKETEQKEDEATGKKKDESEKETGESGGFVRSEGPQRGRQFVSLSPPDVSLWVSDSGTTDEDDERRRRRQRGREQCEK